MAAFRACILQPTRGFLFPEAGMIIPPSSSTVAIGTALALLLASAGSAFWGYQLGRGHATAKGDAALSAFVAEIATAQAQAEQAARLRLQEAQTRGDELEIQLAQEREQRAAAVKELHYETAKTTIGRPCFDGVTLRLLDRAPGIYSGTTAMSTPAGITFTTNGSVATDTQVSGWIIDAAAQYETCRARIDALREWHDGHH